MLPRFVANPDNTPACKHGSPPDWPEASTTDRAAKACRWKGGITPAARNLLAGELALATEAALDRTRAKASAKDHCRRSGAGRDGEMSS